MYQLDLFFFWCASAAPSVLTVQVLEAGVADDRFVFAFSDANFERYGLTAQDGKPAQFFFFGGP